MSDTIDLGLRLTGEDDGFSSVLSRADQASGDAGKQFLALEGAAEDFGSWMRYMASMVDGLQHGLIYLVESVDAVNSTTARSNSTLKDAADMYYTVSGAVSSTVNVVKFFSENKGHMAEYFARAASGMREAAAAAGEYVNKLKNSDAVQSFGAQAKAAGESTAGAFSGLAASANRAIGPVKEVGESATSVIGGLAASATRAIGPIAAMGTAVAAALLPFALIAAAIYIVVKAVEAATASFGLWSGTSSAALRPELAKALADQAKGFKDVGDAAGYSASTVSVFGALMTKNAATFAQYSTGVRGITAGFAEHSTEIEKWTGALKGADGATLSYQQIAAKLVTVLDQYDDVGQTAILQTLGITAAYKDLKAVAAATPEAIAALSAEQARFGLITDETTVAIGDRYTSALREFDRQGKLTADGIKATIGRGLMPLLADLAEWFTGSWPRAVSLFREGYAKLLEYFYSAINGAFTFGQSLKALAETAVNTGGAVARMYVAFKTGELGAIGGIARQAVAESAAAWDKVGADSERRAKEYAARVKAVLNGGTDASGVTDARTRKTFAVPEDDTATASVDKAARDMTLRYLAAVESYRAAQQATLQAAYELFKDFNSRQVVEAQAALQLRLIGEQQFINQTEALKQASADADRKRAGELVAAAEVAYREAEKAYKGASGADDDKRYELLVKMNQQFIRLTDARKQESIADRAASQVAIDANTQRLLSEQKLLDIRLKAKDAADDFIQQLNDEAAARQVEISDIGRTKQELDWLVDSRKYDTQIRLEQRRLARELTEIDRQYAQLSIENINLREIAITESERRIAALRTAQAQSAADFERKTLAASANEWADGITSSIVQGFEQGKSPAEAFRAFLKSQFSKLILTPSIKFLVDGVLGGGSGGSGGLGGLIGSLLGLGGGSSGGGSSGGGILGGLSSLLGLGGGGGFMGSLGGMIAGGAESGFMAGLGSFVANIGSTGLSGAIGSAFSTGFANFAAGGLSGLMTGLGAILGPLAIIVGALAAFGVFDNEKGFKFDNAADAGGSRRTQLISSPFGNYDFAGDFDNKIVQPLIDSVAKMDTAIVSTFLKRPEDLAAARSRVQSITDPKWFGANDEKEIGESLKAASLQFLQTRYSAIFATIDAKISATIKNFTGTADELVQYIGGVIQLSDAFDSIIEMVPQLEISLGDFVNAGEDARNTLGTLAATLKITTMDVVAAADATIAAASRTPSQAIAIVGAKVAELARAFDGSLASAQALASAEQQRLQMVHDLLVQIAQFGNEISAMFAASADGFRLATMSTEEQYSFFDEKAAALFAELQTATDPQRIRELAANYNAVLQSAFGLLDASQKKDVGDEYAKLAEAANAIAQKQLEAARAKEIENAQALGKEIGIAVVQAMEKVAATMQTSADVIAAAADKIDNTFTKGITVTGYIDVSDGQTIVLDRQAGAF